MYPRAPYVGPFRFFFGIVILIGLVQILLAFLGFAHAYGSHCTLRPKTRIMAIAMTSPLYRFGCYLGEDPAK